MNDKLDFIWSRVTKLTDWPTAVVIGINGLDCSGKTFLSDKLRDYLVEKGQDVKLLHVDDYNNHPFQQSSYHRYETKGLDNVNLQDYYEQSIIYKQLRQAILTERLNCQILLVEGVFLYRINLRDLFNLRMFLKVNYSTAINRYQDRKVAVRDSRPISVFTDIWIPVFERYCHDFNPERISEIIFEA